MIAMKKKTKRGCYTRRGPDCDFETNILPSLPRTVEPISLYLRMWQKSNYLNIFSSSKNFEILEDMTLSHTAG